MNYKEYKQYLKTLSKEELNTLYEGMDKDKNPKRYKKLTKVIKKIDSNTDIISETVKPKKITKKTTPYAGYIARFIANLIDYWIYMTLLIIYGYIIGILNNITHISIPLALLFGLLLLSASYTFFYQIYFIKRWGQTIGKMITKIKVVQINGEDISWETAFLRGSIDIILLLLFYLGIMMGFLNLTHNEILSYSYQDLYKSIFLRAPAMFQFIPKLISIWSWSEVVVMFFNPKRRAIQDFLAGTVVIKK